MSIHRILVADDNNDHVLLTLDALEQTLDPSVEVRVARDGREALGVLVGESWVPDLLLLDIQMPVVDGFDVLRRVKSDDRLREVAVVMLTSSADERDALRSHGLGSERFLTKPVSAAALRELVAQILSRSSRVEVNP
jgi:two-component system response regulator